mmetsp:Transcript_1442/g.2992  ORF Transcript_1442/g.2992 Transcript_1442/m.2992 type:complete len:356 (-) Transcript_1442:503-1570(-)
MATPPEDPDGYQDTLVHRGNVRFQFGMRFLLVVDVDHALDDPSDPSDYELQRFNACWHTALGHDSTLVFTTAGSFEDYKEMRRRVPMLVPDVVVAEYGTEIRFMGDSTSEHASAWHAFLTANWHCEAIKNEVVHTCGGQLVMNNPTHQRPLKLSYTLTDLAPGTSAEHSPAVVSLQKHLYEKHLPVRVLARKDSREVVLVPSNAGTGRAVAWLLKQLDHAYGKPLRGAMICTDCGDCSLMLFSMKGVHGCVLHNAPPPMLEWYAENKFILGMNVFATQKPASGGLIEALQHFGLLPLPEGGAQGHVNKETELGKCRVRPVCDYTCSIVGPPRQINDVRLAPFTDEQAPMSSCVVV